MPERDLGSITDSFLSFPLSGCLCFQHTVRIQPLISTSLATCLVQVSIIYHLKGCTWPLWIGPLVLLSPSPCAFSRHNSQRDPVKIQVRSVSSSTQKPLMASHVTQRRSHSLWYGLKDPTQSGSLLRLQLHLQLFLPLPLGSSLVGLPQPSTATWTHTPFSKIVSYTSKTIRLKNTFGILSWNSFYLLNYFFKLHIFRVILGAVQVNGF